MSFAEVIIQKQVRFEGFKMQVLIIEFERLWMWEDWVIHKTTIKNKRKRGDECKIICGTIA